MIEHPDVFVLHPVAHEEEAIHNVLNEQLDHAPTLRVATTPEESLAAITDAKIVLTFELTTKQLNAAESLEWVQALSAGVDSYPVDALSERGVILTNVSGIHAEQMSQQVLGYVLIFERRIHEGLRQQRSGEWESYQGGELGDDTLGVVGLGAVGSRIGELGDYLGMQVVATKRDPSTAPDVAEECYPPDQLEEVLDIADYLVIACPLTDETEGLIGAEEFERLDEDAVLINVARGPIVDQPALISALNADEIRGAALDVSDPEPMPEDSPLRSMDNVVMTPHTAGGSPYYVDRATKLFARNYRAYVSGDKLDNRIV